MRETTLLRFTLLAIRIVGEGRARAVQHGAGHHAPWHAGPQPLNGQAVQDLVANGWLRVSEDRRDLWIGAWPNFAGHDPGAPTHTNATRPERVFSCQEDRHG